MNIVQKDQIIRKLQALTEGPTPLLHHVGNLGDMVVISVQPWGTPMFLSWSQAEMFANELPLQMPTLRKTVKAAEVGYSRKHRRSA